MGSISQLTQAFERLMEKHLWFPHEHQFFNSDETGNERNEYLMNGFEQAIGSLQQLDRLDHQVTWEQWMKLFRSILERTQLPILEQASLGVKVLDVMAARGRPFKILFVLGMNDHVFPRVVREDAFLRDHDRKVLAESLGYKIDEKMTGFDEEALLFALLQQSAQDYLFLLYQRADQNGRPLIPSSFLRDHLERAKARDGDREITFPVGLRERSHISYFSPDHETAQETRLRWVFEGGSLQTMIPNGSPWWKLFQNGMEMIPHLERIGSKGGPFDGVTNANSLHWQEYVSRGFSPTALATYAQCPMRYWMMHVLKVQQIQDPLSRELPSRIWGELVHRVLYEVYQGLAKHGWPQQTVNSLKLSRIVNSYIDQALLNYAQRFGKGYQPSSGIG